MSDAPHPPPWNPPPEPHWGRKLVTWSEDEAAFATRVLMHEGLGMHCAKAEFVGGRKVIAFIRWTVVGGTPTRDVELYETGVRDPRT